MKKKALLVIGEEKITWIRPYVSFGKFVGNARKFKRKSPRFELEVINYTQLLCGNVPAIEASLIKVVLFFPYRYWNRNIEVYQNGRIYGDRRFGRDFKVFFRKVNRAIDKYYKGKKIEYLNSPEACYLDRDKKASKDLLRKRKVPTPRTFRVFSFADIQRLLNKGVSLYIKPRFGAMGKGITYINREEVISNFLFRKGKIISRPSDFNWRFTTIKDGKEFLNELLKKGFICEEAIESAVFKRRRRFDFRIYVIFGKVVYLYAKSSPLESCVTNWSQGGKIDKKKKILRALPKEKVTLLKKMAKRAAQVLGLNFAGIDIIFSKNLKNAYVLEGNAFPGYEKGFDLMECLLKHVVK